MLAGCGGGQRAGEKRPGEAPAEDSSRLMADVIELRAGESRPLVRVPRVGRLRVACRGDGRVAVVFVAARRLPTAAVTVSTERHGVVRRTVQPNQRIRLSAAGPGDLQTWQIAPFAKSAIVTTIWLAIGESAGEPFYVCGASAQAASTPAG